MDDATVAAAPLRPPPVGPAATAAPPGNGKQFGNGRYQVTERLGKGGFGNVYKAYDRNLDKFVAIKTINTEDIEPGDLLNFKRVLDSEAKIVARFEQHPGIVAVHDYDPFAAEPFIVMSLEGATLQKLLEERQRLPWREVVDLGAQVAEALHYAHRKGIQAHRDVKPANIFCVGEGAQGAGRYKVGDFGIARVRKVGGATRSTFFAAGTPRYLAPEQIEAPRTVDGRADIFSLCVVLYEALTGKLPYRGVNLDFDPEEHPASARRIVAAAYAAPTPIRKLVPDVPARLARLIERGLQRDPRGRFKDCGEFAAQLRALTTAGKGTERSPWPRRFVGGAVGIVLVAATYAAWPAMHRWACAQLPSLCGANELAGVRQAAQQAHAEQFAAQTFAQAEQKDADAERFESEPLRTEATGLYRQAAAEAWAIRIRNAKESLAQERRRAEARRAKTYAPQAIEQAAGREHDAEKQVGAAAEAALQSAALLYGDAATKAASAWHRDLGERVAAEKRRLDQWSQNPETPDDAAKDVDQARAQARALVAAAEAALNAEDLSGAAAKVAEVDEIVARTRERAERASFELVLKQAGEARQAAAAARRDAVQARDRAPAAAGTMRSQLDAAAADFAAAESQLAQATSARDIGSARSVEARFRGAAETFAALQNRIQVKAAGDAQQEAEGAVATARSEEAAAEQAGAGTVPAARKTLDDGARFLKAATDHVENDPAKATQEARNAIRLFRDAAARAAAHVAVRQTAKDAVAAATAARAQAKAAGADVLPQAGQPYARGEGALRSATQALAKHPDQARAAASSAADAFTTAQRAATAEIEALRTAVERKRDRAIQAKERAEAGRAPELQAKVLGQGREALAHAEHISLDAPGSLVAALHGYERAIDFFTNAEQDARQPPLEIKEVTPAGKEVTAIPGRPLEFSVTMNASKATARWTLDNGRAPGSDAGLSWVYRPQADADGPRRVRVSVTDGQRTVSRDWTVRMQSPANRPPTITAVTPEARSLTAAEPVIFAAKIEDPDLEQGDEVLCFWSVDGAERGRGACRWRWESPPVGVHRIAVTARDRRGAEAREEWRVEVQTPDPNPLVERWLTEYCRGIEAIYRAEGEDVVVSWRALEVSGKLPTLSVSFVRVDTLGSGSLKEFPKRARLRCAGGDCRGTATGG